ncbi:MAG: nickel-dependent hydrogenase large subunit, partial [candidate division WOR-3 bacterium]
IVEAARGTLIHHYKLDEKALIKEVNLIVATTNNKGAINLSIQQGAREYIKIDEITENSLNLIEIFFRCYDPCFACASHSFGESHLSLVVYDAKKNLIASLP